MAVNDQRSPNRHSPRSPAHGGAGEMEENDVSAAFADEKRKERRQQWLLYVVLFIVFQSVVITLFTLTVMRIKTPKFSLLSATFDGFSVRNSTSNPSFNASMNAEFGIKNANFGRFKYGDSEVRFSYRGRRVAEVAVHKSHAKWRSTWRFDAVVDLNFEGAQWDSRLASDLDSGVVPITSEGRVKGRVELLFVMKKKKWSEMDCSMEIWIVEKRLRNIICR